MDLQALLKPHKPDILDCISNLSSDEVFTPPAIVTEMLDGLPKHLWGDPHTTFLDPCCKSGVFLREISKRLMNGLVDIIPDEEKRREHIFRKMIYGIAITELTSLVSRRTLYYSKKASGEDSVVKFDESSGNIFYQRGSHTYVHGKCKYCRLPENSLDRGEGRENYAYWFIHAISSEVFNVKFDVIIGNPPYQLQDAGESTGASPIYQLFVEQAKKLSPKYISMIIPSRWFAGGKGLDEFRKEMLEDRRISHLVDYHDAADCFPGVEIKGGVCYFLWNSSHDGPCEVTPVFAGERLSSTKRDLSEFDVLVRFNHQATVLRRIVSKNEVSMETIISTQKPFGLRTNFKDFKAAQFKGAVKVYARDAQGWLERNKIVSNLAWVDKWKVILSRSFNGGYKFPHQIINRPIVAEPGSVCTETYIVLGVFEDQKQAINLAGYVRTKFFRFAVSFRKVSQDNPKDRFKYVPKLDFRRAWTDKDLYKRYEITDEEAKFIDTLVKDIDSTAEETFDAE
jgi:site-specific DNA-methyltransferase (adenine-specific)